MRKTNVVPWVLASAIIINFPKRAKSVAGAEQPPVAATPKLAGPRAGGSNGGGIGVGAAVMKGIWVLTAVLWPLLKWIISIDCVFKLIRMVYYWHTPGIHAGVTFLVHFTVLVALTYFVGCYKPKGL